ncbi:hypothetical protein [Aeromonas rivipollensis]|uniref:hypothetical protein n=1 Tax=Aeromonas rivipollensis TaxID=948519 RepID=UPI00372D7777
MEKWIEQRADQYRRHGGKTSRRRTVARLIAICQDIERHEQGIRQPPQIGRAHLHRYWARHADLAPTTQRDHWYAMRLLWDFLGRTGEPPKLVAFSVTVTQS